MIDYADFVGSYPSCLGVSGTVGSTTLNIDRMPAHTHPVHAPQHTSGYGGGGPGQGNSWSMDTTGNTETTGGSQSHTHTLTNITSGSATSVPPYYVLSFIMRTV